MEKFSAVSFFKIGHLVEFISHTYDNHDEEKNRQPVSRSSRGLLQGSIGQIKTECQKIGLNVPLKRLNHLSTSLDVEDNFTWKLLFESLLAFVQEVIWELEDKSFMYLPPERAELYDKPELFGPDVNAKFPSIQFDIVEAGNCYASGRGTACVFHLMRIMEVGVQQFGTKLGVTLVNEKAWQNILDELNKAIKALPKSPDTVEMAEASANLYAVKIAWRNEVMHPKDTYTMEEADNLIRQTRIFMKQLAKIV